MMKRLLVLFASIMLFNECMAFAEVAKDKMVLRYVVRSTRNGDTEMSISGKDGSVTVMRELQKLGCPRTWDKTCFAQRTYNGQISVAKVSGIIDEIFKKDLFTLPKPDYYPAPGDDQYAIGILVDGEKPRYANATKSTLDSNKPFKKVQAQLQKIASKYSKI
jgi:hypothetical protein